MEVSYSIVQLVLNGAEEKELAFFRPHQLHANAHKAGKEVTQEETMTLLWNLYWFQNLQKEDTRSALLKNF